MNKAEYNRLVCCIAGYQIRYVINMSGQEAIIAPPIGVDSAENLLAWLKQSEFKFESKRKKKNK